MKTIEKKKSFSKKPTKKNHKVQKNREVIAEPDTNKVNIDEIQAGSKIEADLKKLKNQQLEEEKIFKQTLIRKNDNEKIICLSCDGSETSKQAFEISVLEFLPRIENSILACTYIYNSRKDEKFNWRYQKQTIIEYYKNKLREKKLDKDKKGFLIIEDKNPDDKQEIEQVYQIARKNGCEGFIVGYNGLKGPTLKRENIALGLHFLLSESTVPTFVMKDKLLRGEKNEGYNWLIVLDRSVSNCMKAFENFLPYMDNKKDCIFGLTVIPLNSNDNLKDEFFKKVKEAGFDEEAQIGYEVLEFKDEYASLVKDYVNYNKDHYFDFVCFYNNQDKYRFQKENSENYKMMTTINANICFTNKAYVEKMK